MAINPCKTKTLPAKKSLLREAPDPQILKSNNEPVPGMSIWIRLLETCIELKFVYVAAGMVIALPAPDSTLSLTLP